MSINRYKQRDEVLKQMGFTSYSEYLRSPLWAKIRARLFRACSTCPCGSPATQVHHTSYKRRYMEGRGKIYRFLVPVCRRCHELIEFDDIGKTPLGLANQRLHEINQAAKDSGIKTGTRLKSKRRKASVRR